MSPETLAKLERIKRYATRYELIAERGETRILILYTSQRSRPGLLVACRQRGPDVVALCCPSGEELITFGENWADGATIGEWRIRFSGRTQREAIIAGELPWIGAAAEMGAAA